MINAEFRMIAAPKIYFKNDAGYRSFYPGELNTNVLMALHTSIAQIAAQQQKIIDDAARAYADAHPVYQAPPPPVDDFFESAKKEMLECTNTDDLVDAEERLTRTLDRSYGEIVENAILNDADGYQVSRIERERDEEKLKVVTFARDLAKQQSDEANKAEQTASNNLAQFNADPIAYLSKSTNAEDRKLAKDLSENTNAPSQ